MTWRDAAAMAAATLRSHGARTVMTILGLAVGVAAVLTVRALGAAGETQVEAEIDRMGVNRVWVTRADGGDMTADDALAAAQAAGTMACAGGTSAAVVTLDGCTAPATITGYDAAMQAVYAVAVTSGRPLLAADHAQRRAVCLLDGALAQELGGDVLGRRICIVGRMFTVVGVADTLPASAMSAGGVAALPLTAWEDTFARGAQEATLAVPPGGDAGSLARAVMAAMGEDYRVRTLAEEVAAARSIVRIFVTVLTCVAAICVVTGGIGVMNVMLLSVRERRREIGLMKALGASSGQVGLLFLLEAAGYACLGGLSGMLLGAALTALCGAWAGIPAALTVRDALPVILLAALLGVCCGVAPAVRAARLEVVDAFRQQ